MKDIDKTRNCEMMQIPQHAVPRQFRAVDSLRVRTDDSSIF